jgi:hypothetical protein
MRLGCGGMGTNSWKFMFYGAKCYGKRVMKGYIYVESVRSSIENVGRKPCRKKPRGSSRLGWKYNIKVRSLR